jgi:glycosyltransferase involved in cell wall biosynthesis/GT2 family glycosyltransferase
LNHSFRDKTPNQDFQETLPEPTKAGIVIVSYNASLAVRVTLASLGQSINKIPYEVILIDNASDAAERKIIRKAFEKQLSLGRLKGRFIQSDKNLGFAGGNNVGIKAFLQDPSITHICLLNSDVIVSDYWLDRLIETRCHIVSPVTNKANSEQCVPADYTVDLGSCLDEEKGLLYDNFYKTVNDFAQNWYKAWQGNLARAEATFFCVLLTRELIRKVGLLDEIFYPGGYEDDDYCARVLAQNINIYLARDVFMHHFGSASFGQLQHNYFSEKAARNIAYLEQKHQFKLQSRHEKPIVSFVQDLAWALAGKGDSQLQQNYLALYNKSVTALVNHIEKEFTSLDHLCKHSGKPIPESLLGSIAQARTYGDIAAQWIDMQKDFNLALETAESDEKQLTAIVASLDNLARATHLKADCNFAMVDYLKAVGALGPAEARGPYPQNGLFRKALWLLRKGSAVMLQPKGIVFFAGYPYPEREKDGYFQRVRSIDSLVKQKRRIYVDYAQLPSKKHWYYKPEPNVLVLHMHNHRHAWFMRALVKILVLKNRTVYFHSVLRMEDGKFGTVMKWPGITRLIDIHGVVPEEFRYHNDFYCGGLFDKHEELAIRKANRIIVVSHAMHRYLQQKYRNALVGSKIITLPIFPEIQLGQPEKPYIRNRPVVVYAGGTHKWQQVPKMIDAIAATKDICIHQFLCPNPSEVVPLFPKELRHNPDITIDSRSFSQLMQEVYPTCHFGFILREDIIVNHAACPTKLVEYVAMGIVPIVDSDQMGDFKELGMQYIGLRDFMAGKLPTEAERNEMARVNYGVYNKLQELNRTGKAVLQGAFGGEKARKFRGSRAKNLLLRVRHKVGVTFSKDTLPGRIIRKTWWTLADFRNNHIRPLLEKDQRAAQLLPTLSPCDILVQVENFTMGGLENVVLDQIAVLQRQENNVTLLILGQSGAAVETARQRGLTVIEIPYNPKSYKQILGSLSPRLITGHYSNKGANIATQLGIPFVQVIHNTYMWFTREEARQMKDSAKHTTAFIAVSEFSRDYSIQRLGLPADKFFVVPNGIDLNSYKHTNVVYQRQALRLKHGFSNTDFVFLSVGTITHQKNHIGTVRAFHKIVKDCPSARLVILGKDVERWLLSDMENYIAAHHLEKYIILAGSSPTPFDYYAMADAFVHSAFFEGGQLSLLEAIAANLPIITSEVGFARHFRGRQGFSIIPSAIDIMTFQEHIDGLHSTPEFEQQMSEEMQKVYARPVPPNLQSRFLDLLDKRYACERYADLLRHLLKKTGPAATPAATWPEIMAPDRQPTLSNLDLSPDNGILSSITRQDVLIQVDNFNVGGLENVVLDQIDTFIRNGISVAFLVLGETGYAYERACKKGIPVYVSRYDDITYAELLSRLTPKVVVTHYSIHGAAVCERLGIPFIQVIHNTYMWFSREQTSQFAEAAKHTSQFIAVSEYARDYSVNRLGISPEKCEVIPNGIDISQFRTRLDQEQRDSLRTKLGIGKDDFVFLSVGSINHQKNHIGTVRAFHTALKECPGAKLVILGKLYENQLWSEIKDYITENRLQTSIIYAGESEDPPAFYLMADAFVHSAIFEGGQLSLLEALAANLPVATTEIGFARHFRGIQGFETVPPAMQIMDYYGPIWELHSTPECERNMAAAMIRIYKAPLQPNIPEKIVQMFDKQQSYRLYVDLIQHYKRGDTTWTAPQVWSQLINGRRQFEPTVKNE